MSVRRLGSLVRGLGYTFEAVQHAPASAGASAVSGSVTSIREFARLIGNPKEFVRG